MSKNVKIAFSFFLFYFSVKRELFLPVFEVQLKAAYSTSWGRIFYDRKRSQTYYFPSYQSDKTSLSTFRPEGRQNINISVTLTFSLVSYSFKTFYFHGPVFCTHNLLSKSVGENSSISYH